MQENAEAIGRHRELFRKEIEGARARNPDDASRYDAVSYACEFVFSSYEESFISGRSFATPFFNLVVAFSSALALMVQLVDLSDEEQLALRDSIKGMVSLQLAKVRPNDTEYADKTSDPDAAISAEHNGS